MSDDPRKQLIDLGPEILADALLRLTDSCKEADHIVKTLTTFLPEAVKSFKDQLHDLQHGEKITEQSMTVEFGKQLSNLLESLKTSIEPPVIGVDLLALFFQADKKIFDRCFDYAALISDIFRIQAKEMFVEFASKCEGKYGLIDTVLSLNQQDNYGVRISLIHCAKQYLAEDDIRDMFQWIQNMLELETGVEQRNHWFCCLKSLAKQIGDKPLLEKIISDFD